MSSESVPETSSKKSKDAGSDDKKTEFSSTCSMFVTLLGYSLGMTDIWRFPFLVYRNGGGAFLIPFSITIVLCGIPMYFLEYSMANFLRSCAFLIPFSITIVLCGIPMYFLEYSMANFSGKGPYAIWEISPLFRGVGVSIAVAYFIWMVGTTVFRSWLAMFLLDSFTSPLPWTHCQNSWNTPTCRDNPFVESVDVSNLTSTANSSDTSYLSGTTNMTAAVNRSTSGGMTSAEEYWQFEALGLSSGITDLSPILWKHILCMLVFRVIVFLSLVKSIKSIEKVMYVLMIVPLLFQLVVMIQCVTLPGVGEGLYEFFYPDFAKLKNARIWIEAFLMAFYSIGFGWGAILTIGSHANFHDNLLRTSVLLPMLDGLVAVANGAVCFMVLGTMAHAYGVKVYDVIKAGFSAGIVTYVSALSVLPYPQIWNFLFIVTVILMGMDSQIVPMEMCLQVLGEMFPNLYPRYRIHALIIMSVLLFVLALPTCTGAGGYIFLWFDWYTGVWVGPICALMEVIAVAWIYGMDRFSMDISLMTGRPAPWFFRFFITFFAPIVVFGIFLTACVEYVPPKYGSYIYPPWARGVGWMIVFCILSPILIVAFLVVHKQSGSITKKIKESAKSTNLWRPKDYEASKEYESQITLYKNRTLGDMFYFIMFGSYKEHSYNVSKRELSV